jgi:hypothetical protein
MKNDWDGTRGRDCSLLRFPPRPALFIHITDLFQKLDSIALDSISACEELDAGIGSVRQALEERARRSRSARNGYAPVNRLPDELIERVLHATGQYLHSRDTRVFACSQVCQRWRRIALSNPTLWTELEPWLNHSNPRIAQEWMKRAKNQPLIVSWTCPELSFPDADSRERETRTIKHVLSQGTVGRLAVDGSHEELLPIIQLYARSRRTEHLQQLVVVLDEGGGEDDEWLLPFANSEMTETPHKLQHLSLHNCHLVPDSILFHHLRSLDISTDFARPLHMDDVLLMLRSAPLLESIALKGLVSDDTWAQHSQSSSAHQYDQQLRLDSLASFTFEDHLAPGLIIMRLVRAPLLRSIILHEISFGDEHKVLNFAAAVNAFRDRTAHDPEWRLVTGVSVSIHTAAWFAHTCLRLITSTDAEAEIETETRDDHSLRLFKAIANGLDWTNVTTFSFSVDDVNWKLLDSDPNAWINLYTRMPHLTHLKASTKGAFHVGEALAFSLPSSVLPKLKIISLEHTDLLYTRAETSFPHTTILCLLRFVAVRRDMGLPLEHLKMSNCGMAARPLNTVADLRALVPGHGFPAELDISITPPGNDGGQNPWTY